MKRIGLVAGAAFALLLVIAAGGFRVSFPSWVSLPTTTQPQPQPQPPVIPDKPVVNVTHSLPSSMMVGDAISLEMQLTHSKLLKDGSGELYLVALLKAKEVAEARGDRPPLNLSLVIDRSGSMEARGKMEKAKEAAKRIVKRLSAEDYISIVAYSTDAEVLLSARAPTNLDEIFRIIDDIEPVGATNLSEGLELGRKEVEKNLSGKAINRVLLLSDGKANMGIKDPRRLAELSQTIAQAGVSVTCLGLGKDFNEDLMLDIAEFGRGNFYFIERSNQILDIFQKELKGLLAAVAKDVELTIKPGAEVSIERVYGYRPTFQKSQVSIPLGSISSGQERKIVMKIKVKTGKVGPLTVADAELNYENLLSKAKVSDKAIVGLAVTEKPALVDAGRSNKALARAETVVAAENLNEVVAQVKAKKDGEAIRMLKQQIEVTRDRNRVYNDQYLNTQVSQMEEMLDDIEQGRLNSERRAIVVKQGKTQSYLMMR